MDARRVTLPFLLLVIGAIGVTAAVITNGRGGPNNIRRIRRISLNEYLVPPPPPKLHPPSRTGRLANPEPTQPPGYFAQFMSWFDPFGFISSPSSPASLSPPPLSPPPIHSEIPYPPSPRIIHRPPVSSGSLESYNDPSPATYDKPPFPQPAYDRHPSGYISFDKSKSCNSCNKVPWMPIRPDGPSNSRDVPLGHSPPLLPPNDNYLPHNEVVPHDVHHAATQEIRNPDVSFVPHSGDGSFIGPAPNPQLYTGPLPFLETENLNYVAQTVPDVNSRYHGTPSSSVSGDVPTGNESFLGATGSGLNSRYNGQSVYQNPSSHSDAGIVRQQVGYPGFQDHDRNNDLSSSGTQVSHGHADPTLDQPDQLKVISTHQGSFNSANDQALFGSTTILNRPPSGVSNNGGYTYDVTAPNGPSGVFGNSSQLDRNPPGSFGISDLDRIPNSFEQRYNDLSSSGNVAKESYAPTRATDETTAKNSIHFEESLLLDFTHKGESRPGLSSIPPTSNAFAGFESTEAATTLTSVDEIPGTHQRVATTKSHFVNYFHIDPVNVDDDDATQELNDSDRDYKILQWQNVDPKDVDEAPVRQQSAKRNKQVQVIIPYTSQYTPVPFQSAREQNASYTGESNRDNYVGEESRNRIKVVSLPDSSRTFETWRTILPISENVTKKPINTKANNSIDVHRLQKNIDNWTIQEYSKGTTASTEPPSSANPYLFPSKQIPDEYLTTEPINVADSHDNVKTLTLGGFSFNDVEYKESASDRVEGSRVPVIRIENTKSTESPTDASTEDDITWQGFPMDIDPVNKERVYVVTPQSAATTPKSNLVEQKRERVAEKEAERDEGGDSKESKDMETEEAETKPNTFESIEKVYQVLPQAVNNLAVAFTGPEKVPLWGIMEHDDLASPADSEHDYEDDETPKIVLHAGHSKVSRGRR